MDITATLIVLTVVSVFIEVDFLSSLHAHAIIIKKIVDDLEQCFSDTKEKHCRAILDDQHQASAIRDSNMKELLNSFITLVKPGLYPYHRTFEVTSRAFKTLRKDDIKTAQNAKRVIDGYDEMMVVYKKWHNCLYREIRKRYLYIKRFCHN